MVTKTKKTSSRTRGTLVRGQKVTKATTSTKKAKTVAAPLKVKVKKLIETKKKAPVRTTAKKATVLRKKEVPTIVRKTKASTKVKPKITEVSEEGNQEQLGIQETMQVDGVPTDFVPYSLASNEEYMSDGQLKHFKGLLENLRRELMLEADHTLEEMKAFEVSPDLNDRATQEENVNFELRARDRERKLLSKVFEALERIEDHSYGYCNSCGVEIGLRRLEARPTATLCIDCKTLAEIKEKRL